MTKHRDIIDIRLPEKPVEKPRGPMTYPAPSGDSSLGLAVILACALAALLVVASVLR